MFLHLPKEKVNSSVRCGARPVGVGHDDHLVVPEFADVLIAFLVRSRAEGVMMTFELSFWSICRSGPSRRLTPCRAGRIAWFFRSLPVWQNRRRNHPSTRYISLRGRIPLLAVASFPREGADLEGGLRRVSSRARRAASRAPRQLRHFPKSCLGPRDSPPDSCLICRRRSPRSPLTSLFRVLSSFSLRTGGCGSDADEHRPKPRAGLRP